MGRIRIGTSGYSYAHWKEIFYPVGIPQAKWLSFYAEHFDTVEINATFYRHFERHVFEKWAALTPETFTFTIKGPKSITRDKRLLDVGEDLARFMDSAQGLGNKLGVMLWQMPPSFKKDEENMRRLQEFLGMMTTEARHVIEMRHPSWCDEEAYALLDRYGAGWVSADSARFISVEKVTGNLGYFRYHGPRELYSSSYSNEELIALAEKARTYAQNGDVYCYFNNDFHGYALENATLLRALIESPSYPTG